MGINGERTLPSDVKKTTRYDFIDVLRILGCFLVLVNHSVSDIFKPRDPEHLLWMASVCYFFISKAAVPIFIMVAGYLMLDKQDSWGKAFLRMARIGIVILACGVVYPVYYQSRGGPAALDMIKQLNLLAPTNALWYLYLYLGILLMMPLLQKMTRGMERKDFHVFFAVAFLYSGTLPILTHYHDSIAISSHFQIPVFGSYLWMLLIGGYLKRFEVKKSRAGIVAAVLLLCAMTAFNVIGTCYEYIRLDGKGYMFYDSIVYFPEVVSAACWFYLAMCLKLPVRVQKAVQYIGGCTFGIYLFGDMFLHETRDFMLSITSATGITVIGGIVLYQAGIFLAGLAVTGMLKYGMKD